jgi:hypothetical protein
MLSHFTVQFIERVEDLLEDLATTWRQSVDARCFRAFGLGGTKPATLRHSREHRIQRPRAEAVAVVVQLLKHPLTVDTLFARVVKNVDLPEGEQKLADDGIAHGP